MLLACTQNGWSTHDYLSPEHPLQQAILQGVRQWSQCPQVETGIDGCSAPTFYLPLDGLARLFAALASAEALSRLRQAMTQHPLLVGGVGRIDTLIMALTQGRLVAKVGADGVMAVGNVALKQGLALKVWSGRDDIRNVTLLHQLRALGWLDVQAYETLSLAWPVEKRNAAGLVIGCVRFQENAPAA
jgi:L-asparaginase II